MSILTIIDAAAARMTLAERLNPGGTYGGALEKLAELVRVYLDARTLADGQPCMHRYRGKVRTNEIARRRRLLLEASNALEAAIGWKFPGGVK